MPVYVLRVDFSNVFKIYRTCKGADGVVQGLRARDSERLNVFEVLNTDHDGACEAVLRRNLVEKRVDRDDRTGLFEVDAIEMLTIVRQVRSMFEELVGDLEAVRGYAGEISTDRLIEASDEDEKLIGQLVRNKDEQECLAFERELLENKLKHRIGSASGIRGLVTWKTQVRRLYNEELFRNSEPELYQELLERYYCLDTKAWRANRPDQYKGIQSTYFLPSSCRIFKLQDEY
jgi:hypothetical protein